MTQQLCSGVVLLIEVASFLQKGRPVFVFAVICNSFCTGWGSESSNSINLRTGEFQICHTMLHARIRILTGLLFTTVAALISSMKVISVQLHAGSQAKLIVLTIRILCYNLPRQFA